MSEEEIIGKINWAIHVNEMTKSINGDNTHISVNVLQGLMDLYNKEKEKNKENIEAIEEWINGERISPVIEQKYISKDKIKKLLEKIKQEHDVAITKMLNEDYHLAENGAVCQTLGYIEGQIEELLKGE